MERLQGLRSVNLLGCGLKDEAAKALGRALAGKTELRRLEVHQNSLGDAGGSVLCAALQEATELEALHTQRFRQEIDNFW